MRIDGIRLAIHDVHAAAVSLPARNAGCEALGRISEAAIVLVFVFVFFGVGSGIAALPESLDKLVALRIGRQLFERGFFVPGNDPANVLIQPFLVIFAHLLRLGALLLFLREGPLEWVLLLINLL